MRSPRKSIFIVFLFVLQFFWLLFLRQLLIDTISCQYVTILSRIIRLHHLFPLFPKMEMSKSEQSSPMMPRFLLNLRAEPWFLTNPRLPLKKKWNPRLPKQPSLFLPLFLQRTNGREATWKIPAPLNRAVLLSRKLLPKNLSPSTPTRPPLLAHKLP